MMDKQKVEASVEVNVGDLFKTINFEFYIDADYEEDDIYDYLSECVSYNFRVVKEKVERLYTVECTYGVEVKTIAMSEAEAMQNVLGWFEKQYSIRLNPSKCQVVNVERPSYDETIKYSQVK